MRPSMGSVGDAYDNAMCESFFATLECELLARHRFNSQVDARMAVFAFIEGFYNRRRRHSSLGYLSPVNYEQRLARRPDPQQLAVVLAAVKDEPSGQPQAAVLDCPLDTPATHACGPGRKNGSAGAEQKNIGEEEADMTSHQRA